MRLQRALARAGVTSRRRAEELIRAGRVRINGRRAELGMSADPTADRITVDGRRIRLQPVVWMALNKPLGHVVSARDPEGRHTVFALVPPTPGLTYVGRLDVMTAGLLLLTTDGAAVHRLTHPRYEVERSYRVLVHGRSADDIARRLRRPVVVDRRPVALRSFSLHPAGAAVDLHLVLTEGRHRIVRLLCDAVGLKVERLIRVSHGPVRLGRLPVGKWRYLSRTERAALEALTD